MAFSASTAAVEGFRVLRREHRNVLIWAGVLVVLHFGAAMLMFPLWRFSEARPSGGSATDAVVRDFIVVGAELLVMVVLASLMACAIYRSILRPHEGRFGRLKLGGDELRMVGVVLPQALLFTIAASVALVAAVTIVLLAQFGLTGSSKGPPSTPMVLVVFAAMLLVVTGWIGARLSLAGPMTFVEGRLRLFASWGLTRRAFWPLLGCYAMAFVLTVLIYLVALSFSGVAGAAVAGRPVTDAFSYLLRSDATSLQTYFPLGKVAAMAFIAAFSAVTWTVMLAPAAAAYRAIAGLGPERQAEVFD